MILSYSSATHLQVDLGEAEDLEEELVDGLEDCCSHDENEEEEGKGPSYLPLGSGHHLQGKGADSCMLAP